MKGRHNHSNVWLGTSIAGRTAMLLCGLFVTSMGIAFSAKAGLGTTPQAALPYVLSLGTPLSLGAWTFIVNAVFIVIQWAFSGFKTDTMLILQIPTMIVFSVLNDVAMIIIGPLSPAGTIETWLTLCLGIVCLSVGTAVTVISDLSYCPADGIVRMVSVRIRRRFGTVKLCSDLVMVSLAITASITMFGTLDGVREGTLVAMLLIGPAVRTITTRVESRGGTATAL